MHVSPDRFDLDAFTAFVRACGCVVLDPRSASGEVLRFRWGNAIGVVARKQSGHLTLVSVARQMFAKFKADRRTRTAAHHGSRPT